MTKVSLDNRAKMSTINKVTLIFVSSAQTCPIHFNITSTESSDDGLNTERKFNRILTPLMSASEPAGSSFHTQH